MTPMHTDLTGILGRRRLPVWTLDGLVAELRRDGRALTPGAVLRLAEAPATGVRILRPWTGLLAPLAPGAATAPARRRARRRERAPEAKAGGRRPARPIGRGHLTLSAGDDVPAVPGRGRRDIDPVARGADGPVLVVGADPSPDGGEASKPCTLWRLLRAVLHLARTVDGASALASARWLQIHLEAERLAA
jgi:hypothetical protein